MKNKEFRINVKVPESMEEFEELFDGRDQLKRPQDNMMLVIDPDSFQPCILYARNRDKGYGSYDYYFYTMELAQDLQAIGNQK